MKRPSLLLLLVMATSSSLALAQPEQPDEPPPEQGHATEAPDTGTPTPPPPPPETPEKKPAETPSTEENEKDSLDEGVLNLLKSGDRVPDNPAIDLLGAEDLKISRPSAFKDLSTELRALYKDGKIVPEIAVEFSPWALTLGRSSNYTDYVDDAWRRVLRRTLLSVATTSSGEGDEEATLGAVSLRIGIVNEGDWRMNNELLECVFGAVDTPKPPPAPFKNNPVLVPGQGDGSAAGSNGSEKAPAAGGAEGTGKGSADPSPTGATTGVGEGTKATGSEGKKETVDSCITKHPVRWNASQWVVGAAASSAFPGGEIKRDLLDFAVWSVFSRDIGDSIRVSLGGKYQFADARGAMGVLTPKRHIVGGTSEFELRGAKYSLILSLGLGRGKEPMDTLWLGMVGGEVQMQMRADTWLALRFSADIVEKDDSSFLSLANFKWSYDTSPKKASTKNDSKKDAGASDKKNEGN